MITWNGKQMFVTSHSSEQYQPAWGIAPTNYPSNLPEPSQSEI